MDTRTLAAVAVGGVAGATARWLLIEATTEPTGWPWAIFVANVVGSFLLGVVLTRTPSTANRFVLPALGVGFCGSLTTFSSFAVDLAIFLRDDRLSLALVYLAVSLVGGATAYLAGRTLGATGAAP